MSIKTAIRTAYNPIECLSLVSLRQSRGAGSVSPPRSLGKPRASRNKGMAGFLARSNGSGTVIISKSRKDCSNGYDRYARDSYSYRHSQRNSGEVMAGGLENRSWKLG